MVKTVLGRLQRVVSVGVGEALDAAERFSGLGLLRESIRKADADVADSKRRLTAAIARRTEAAEQQARYRKQAAGLTEDARFALDKKRPDLAERVIARQLDLEDEVRRIAASEARLVVEEERLAAEIREFEAVRAALTAELAAASVDVGGAASPVTALRREEDIAARLAALKDSVPGKTKTPAKSKRGSKP